MTRERRMGWWGKTLLLGADSALAVGLGGGMVSPALAQTASAASASLPTACPGLEALVSDEVDGPDPWGQGEVIKFATSLSQGTLTNNLSPAGGPNLDSPEDMAFDLNGNVVTRRRRHHQRWRRGPVTGKHNRSGRPALVAGRPGPRQRQVDAAVLAFAAAFSACL
jgi:hypothetical protein